MLTNLLDYMLFGLFLQSHFSQLSLFDQSLVDTFALAEFTHFHSRIYPFVTTIDVVKLLVCFTAPAHFFCNHGTIGIDCRDKSVVSSYFFSVLLTSAFFCFEVFNLHFLNSIIVEMKTSV